MAQSKAKQIIAELDQIPTLPTSVTKMMGVMDDPDSTVNDIIRAIDTSTCAKILSVANSAYYATLQEVRSIEHAIAILGRNTIHDMVLGISIVNLFDGDDRGKKANYQRFWQRTIISTQLSVMFGKLTKNPDPSKIYTVGLIHNIGEIVFFLFFPDEYISMQKLQEEQALSQMEAEKRVFEITHPAVGEAMARKWKLPEDMTRIIRYHEAPENLKEDLDELKIGMIINAGDTMTRELAHAESWDLLFDDEEKLKSVFINMNSMANSLMREMVQFARAHSVVGDWSAMIEEELAFASAAVKPMMQILLSRSYSNTP